MTLSQRAAALAGPDRAVDAEIAVALGYVVCPDQGRWRIYGKGVPKSNKRSLPRFTGSLDAAMTVVPDDWTAWGIWSRRGKTKFMAILTRLSDDMDKDGDNAGDEERVQSPRCTTPALALLSAALAARGL